MKRVLLAIALLAGSLGVASAQGGFGPRQPDYEGYGHRGGRAGAYFDEREYLRCNPDVWRAVRRGEQPSGWAHYQKFGRYEGRRLRC